MNNLFAAIFCLSVTSAITNANAQTATQQKPLLSNSRVSGYLKTVDDLVDGRLSGSVPVGSQVLDMEAYQSNDRGQISEGANLFFKTPTGSVYYIFMSPSGSAISFTNPIDFDRKAFLGELQGQLNSRSVRVNELNEEYRKLYSVKTTWTLNSKDSIAVADAIAREVKRKKNVAQILDVGFEGHWPEVQDAKDIIGKGLDVRVIIRNLNGRYEAWSFVLDSHLSYDEWLSKSFGTRTNLVYDRIEFLKAANEITRQANLNLSPHRSIQFIPAGTIVTFPSGFKLEKNGSATLIGGNFAHYSDSLYNNMEYWRYTCSVNSYLSEAKTLKNSQDLQFMVADVQSDAPAPYTNTITMRGARGWGSVSRISCTCIDSERNGACPFRFGTFKKFLNDQGIQLEVPTK